MAALHARKLLLCRSQDMHGSPGERPENGELALGHVMRVCELVGAVALRCGASDGARQGSAHSEPALAPGSARGAPSCSRESSRSPATWRSPAWAWAKRRRLRWSPTWTPSCTARPASRSTRRCRRSSRPTTRCAGCRRGGAAVHAMHVYIYQYGQDASACNQEGPCSFAGVALWRAWIACNILMESPHVVPRAAGC